MAKRLEMNPPSPRVAEHSEQRKALTLLAVGSPEEWERRGNPYPSSGQVTFVSFQDVTATLLEQLQPKTIVSPVLARGFDCIDLAQLLHALNYTGAYRAMAEHLPNPRMIETEIAHLCPRLDFEVLTSA
jgi:hypothetical protein